jgi:hypothetical protein
MDFIERIFNIAPDGGSGALEWLILLAFIILPLFSRLFLKRRRAARIHRPSTSWR